MQNTANCTASDGFKSKRFIPPPGEAETLLNISIVTETYPPEINGVALTLARLAEGLRNRGHQVSVVRPRQPSFQATKSDDDAGDVFIPGIPLPGYSGLNMGLPAGNALRKQWLRQCPEVIYVATEGPLGWSAVGSARRLNIPVLSGFHTNFDVYARHYHATYFEPLISLYLRMFHNRTASTLVPSADVRERLGAIGVKNVHVLGRGVDGDLFTPKKRSGALRHSWGISKDEVVALYVGRVAAEKNIELAIGAYRVMQRAGAVAKFVIVGDGPLRSALQTKHPDLIFSGAKRGDELAKHYASADVFLFPSESETFGNVTLEAMASGLSVVAYDYAAAREHIVHGKTGVLVPYGNSQAFVDAAVGLAAEPMLLNAIGPRARNHAVSVDWRHVIDRFTSLLAQIRDNSTSATRLHIGFPLKSVP